VAFKSEKEAEEAFRKAKRILKELAEFYDEWQYIRGRITKSVEKRHEELLQQFPLVAKFIELPQPKKDEESMDYLAGYCNISHHFIIERTGNEIWLMDKVWYLATWDNLLTMFKKLGATKGGWLSEGRVYFWNLVELRPLE